MTSPKLPSQSRLGDTENDLPGLGEPENNYGEGVGWARRDWERFAQEQAKAADNADVAADRLWAAIGGVQSSAPSDADWKTIREFEAIMGKEMATPDNMKQAALRYEQASRILRDQTNYKAHAIPGDAFDRNDLRHSIMARVPDRPNDIVVNKGHGGFRLREHLRGGLRHEPFHQMGQEDQLGSNKQKAYFDGTPEEFDAYRELTEKADGRSLINPDHLAQFARRR